MVDKKVSLAAQKQSTVDDPNGRPSIRGVLDDEDVLAAALATIANPPEQQLALMVPTSTALTERRGTSLIVSDTTSTTISTGNHQLRDLESYVRTTTPQHGKNPPPRSLLMDRTPPPPSNALTNASPALVDDSIAPYIGTVTDPFLPSPLTLLQLNDHCNDVEDPFAADLLQEPLLRNLNLGRSRHASAVVTNNNQNNITWWQEVCCSLTSTASMLLVVLFAMAMAFLILILDEETCSSSSSSSSSATDNRTIWYPAAVRYQRLLECVDLAAVVAQAPASTLQSQAVDWFLTGPGRQVTISSTNETPSSSSSPDAIAMANCEAAFAPLFSLIALRDAVHVLDKKWHSSTNVHNLSDICTPSTNFWPRMECSAPSSTSTDTGDDDDDDHVLHVTKLVFNNASLTGTFPMEMVLGLSHLTSLEAYTNENLVGTLPEFMSHLTHLQVLQLHGTGVSGSIPASWSQLTALRTLLLHDTHITGSVPDALCQLKTLHLQMICVPETVTCACCSSVESMST